MLARHVDSILLLPRMQLSRFKLLSIGAVMTSRWLTALPVFNEVRHVNSVLDEVRRYCREVLVVDGGFLASGVNQ